MKRKAVLPSLNSARPAECSPRAPLEIIFFGVHIGSGYGGDQYASYRASPGRPRLLLSELRAAVPVTHSRPRSTSERESNIAKCVVCGKIMGQWASTDIRISSNSFTGLKMPNQSAASFIARGMWVQ